MDVKRGVSKSNEVCSDSIDIGSHSRAGRAISAGAYCALTLLCVIRHGILRADRVEEPHDVADTTSPDQVKLTTEAVSQLPNTEAES